jgi:hypothetical protein
MLAHGPVGVQLRRRNSRKRRLRKSAIARKIVCDQALQPGTRPVRSVHSNLDAPTRGGGFSAPAAAKARDNSIAADLVPTSHMIRAVSMTAGLLLLVVATRAPARGPNGTGGTASPSEPQANTAPPPTPRLRTHVSEVIVPVTVTDKKGELVLNLTPKDFRIFDKTSCAFGAPPSMKIELSGLSDGSVHDTSDAGRRLLGGRDKPL